MRYHVKKKIKILSVQPRIFRSKNNEISKPQGSVPSKIRERKLWKERKLFLENAQ
jgi:hypothetical protein